MSQTPDDYPTCQKCGAELPVPMPGELSRCLNCNTIAGISPNAASPSDRLPGGEPPAPNASTPMDVTPIDAVPVTPTPAPQTPLDASPIDAVPVDPTPIEAVPVDAIPASTTPNHTTHGESENIPPPIPAERSAGGVNPYLAPVSDTTPTNQVVGVSVGFVVVAVLAMIGLVTVFPFGIVPVFVLGTTSLFRSQAALSRSNFHVSHEVTFGDQAIAFAKSLAVCVAIAIASFVAFFVTCLSMLPFAFRGSVSDGLEVIGVVLLFGVPVLVFFGLVAKTWPKKRSAEF